MILNVARTLFLLVCSLLLPSVLCLLFLLLLLKAVDFPIFTRYHHRIIAMIAGFCSVRMTTSILQASHLRTVGLSNDLPEYADNREKKVQNKYKSWRTGIPADAHHILALPRGVTSICLELTLQTSCSHHCSETEPRRCGEGRWRPSFASCLAAVWGSPFKVPSGEDRFHSVDPPSPRQEAYPRIKFGSNYR